MVSPARSVELVTEFHTVHTDSFDFSIFGQLTSGFLPLGIKNEKINLCFTLSGSKGEEDYFQEGEEGEEDAVL